VPNLISVRVADCKLANLKVGIIETRRPENRKLSETRGRRGPSEMSVREESPWGVGGGGPRGQPTWPCDSDCRSRGRRPRWQGGKGLVFDQCLTGVEGGRHLTGRGRKGLKEAEGIEPPPARYPPPDPSSRLQTL
jgi:hypothetical protein